MRVLLIGFGTVGQGVAEILLEKRDYLAKEKGMEFNVVGIFDKELGGVYRPQGINLEEALETIHSGGNLTQVHGESLDEDPSGFIQKAEAEVMVEMTYTDLKTAQPATSYIRAALDGNMHVVTTNKGPVALNYKDLSIHAAENGLEFLFEGTVMSGTPLISVIQENLISSHIREVKGILNGTTNYILSRMEEGLSYQKALEKSQELGYAEAQPEADVRGWDALAKVSILANVIFGANRKPFDYPCEGITEVSANDLIRVKDQGKRIKLIGKTWMEGNFVKASVGPEEIDFTHPLAGVKGAFNALTITTEDVGEVTIVGPGAGQRESAYGVLRDLMAIGGKQ
ncbi:homoserine dehydrogenase [bacterium]|nr:homoserine dehydrogenase [bacterium]